MHMDTYRDILQWGTGFLFSGIVTRKYPGLFSPWMMPGRAYRLCRHSDHVVFVLRHMRHVATAAVASFIPEVVAR